MSEEVKGGLDEKYRPQTLEDICGNDSLLEGIKSALTKGESCPRTWIFHGSRGCGKTTLSKIVARELGADPDTGIKELNISHTRGIDAAKEIIKDLGFAPLKGICKVYILNEIQGSTKDFQEAMLEVLETPPKHVRFILCTTEPQKLLPTVMDRTKSAVFKVSTLDSQKIRKLLATIIKGEGSNISEFPEKVINAIVDKCEGIPRNAVKILDMVFDIMDENQAIELINNSYVAIDDSTTISLCQAIKDKKPWDEVRAIIRKLPGDPESTRYAILGYFNSVLLNSKSNDWAADVIAVLSESVMYSKQAGLSAMIYTLVTGK
jgi:DNA polymerase-3 subunit gamma/tau